MSSSSSLHAPPARFANAARVHQSLTAGIEKRVLLWIAARIPYSVNSDHLTVFGFVAQILAGAAYAVAGHHLRALWLVNFFLLLNWVGDSLDGTVARLRGRQRPRYGFYVDHIADTFGALALIAGMALSQFVHWPVAVAMLVCFYVLSIESYLAAYTIGRFHLSHGLFGPTEIRILLAIGNAVLISHRCVQFAGRTFLLFDVGGFIAIIGMASMALNAALRHTAELYRAETL
ncbi:MAG: CDP-alcohol phosphatidyltransferase family protein [Acidobacteriaceae bacterium]|nr:CDP-alcohol phosphatidyltransferase family protein [Acidobacteriaceae bacterium]